MKSVNDGSFRIDPFEFDNIQELKIEKRLNEHATLYVKGVVKTLWRDMPVMDATQYTNIKCADDDNVYFSGILQNVAITSVDDVYYLEAYAISHTIKLDTKRHKRSFQDSGGTYQDIVEAIIGDAGGIVNYHADAKTVEKILVQYDETDWQFAKRLASHTQDVLTPISTSDEPDFHFGVEDESCAGELVTANFSTLKDFDLLRLRSNDDQPLDEDCITMYQVKTDEFAYGMFDVGNKVTLNKQELYVRHALLIMEQSVIFCQYSLSSRKAITAPKTYNSNITGLALAGVVQVVENDDVKLDLHIDYKPGTIQFFKYATDYSPESHTGWYVMPEVGDTVFLVFPTEDEKDAHASSSMRQSATGKTGDPLVKFLRTPFGKEMKLDEKEVLLTAKDDETYIKINEDSGVEIFTLKPINAFANETTDVTSTDDMSITSIGDMRISSDANLTISAKDSIEVSCGENIINITPEAGIILNTDTEINILSKNDTKAISSAKMAFTSGDDMKISSNNMLFKSGIKSLVLNNGGNSISMEPLKGINVASSKNLNMGSVGDAHIVSAGSLTLSAKKDFKSRARKKIVVSGNVGVEIGSGGSVIKLTPAGLDVKSPSLKEN